MYSGTTEVVLTGGPCSGKSSVKGCLADRMSAFGVRIFFIPEVASMLIDPALPDIGEMARTNSGRFIEIEKQIILIQQSLRQHYRQIAGLFPAERCLIVADRGECDAAAYVGWKAFMALLAEVDLSLTEVRDSYHAAIHLVTAAKGVEYAYTLANNNARRETADEARAADDRTLAVWCGHPHLIVVDNSTDFEAKMHRTIQALTRVLGIPVPLEDERKFLLSRPPNLSCPEKAMARPIEIEQHYLRATEGEQRRIRRRTDCGHSSYFLTTKRSAGRLGRNIETNHLIQPEEYLMLLAEADPSCLPVRKTRRCFVWRNLYFELDEFHHPRQLWLLEVELTEENQSVELPPWLSIEREVTDDPAFYSFYVAQADSGLSVPRPGVN
jgi:CYTH domain-containing protein/predicted ATPase